MLAREAFDQRHVERLGEARVRDGAQDALGGQLFGRGKALLQACAIGQDGNIQALAQDPPAPDLERRAALRQHQAKPVAARIAEGGRPIVDRRGRGDHVHQFQLIGRGHQDHVGQAAEIDDVEGAGVRCTVGADQAGAIQGKAHGQALQRHVVHHLVVGALKERRVDGAERLHPFGRHAGGEGDGMLLGDADVEGAIGEALGEKIEPGPRRHRRRHGDDPLIGRGLGGQRLGEDLGVGRRTGWCLGLLAGDDIELRDAVVLVGALFGRGVALALPGHDMQQDRAPVVRVPQVAQHRHQVVEVVPVDRADIVEAQLLEQCPAGQQAARELVGAPRHLLERTWEAARHLGHQVAQRQERPRGDQTRQVSAHGADGRRDRHVVVVQHHDHVGAAGAGVVHGLVGHAGAHGAVADDGDDLPVLALQPARHRHSQPGRNRGRGMGGAERVVLAFGAAGESGKAATLANRANPVAAAGEDLVGISLMADIPDQPITWRVEHRVEGHGQLDHAERGAEVAAGDGNRFDRLGAQLRGERLQLFRRQIAQVGRVPHPVEEWCLGRYTHGRSLLRSCACACSPRI